MNNFSPATFQLLIFLCFLIVCYYHLNRFLVLLLLWLVGFASPHCFKRSFSHAVCKLWFSHHRTGFTFPYISLFSTPLTWHFSVSLACHLALAAWCNMTTKTKQETYTTPGAIVHILRREFPKLSVWMERIIRRFVKTRSMCSRGAGKICRRSPLACSSRDRGFHCFPVGMCGRDGKGWASLLHYNRVASIMPPFSLSVWPTSLVYWFNLLLLLIIYFPSSPSIVRNRTTGLWRTDFS